jgi:hypothetical protein
MSKASGLQKIESTGHRAIDFKQKACHVLAAAGSVGPKQLSTAVPSPAPIVLAAPPRFSFCPLRKFSALPSAFEPSLLPIVLSARG